MKSEKLIQQIIKWYLSDTIELLDEVLSDDDIDPQYSAVTAYNRLILYLEFKNVKVDCNPWDTLVEFLLKSGYALETIKIFKEKYNKEKEST